MDRKTEQFLKIFPLSKELIGTEARKIMTEGCHKKLVRKKQDGTIKKEIRKLKQLLENNRILKNRELENNRNGKSKHFMVLPKFTKQHTKLWKRFESYDCLWEDNTWFGPSIQMAMETKITSNIIPFDIKACLKKQDTEIVDDRLQPTSCNRKGSIISCEDETSFEENLAYFSNSEKGIIQRFLEDISKAKVINVDKKETAECVMYVINQMDLLQRDRKEIGQDNNLNKVVRMGSSKMKSPEIRPYRCSDKKELEKAWKIWRNFTSATKQKEREREEVGNKVEAFLTRIQGRIGVENIVKQKRPEKIIKTFRDLKMTNENLNGRMRTREKMHERQKNLTEKEWNLEEIMGEIKSSRKESYERLLTFERRGKRERSKVLKIHASVSENVDKRSKNFPTPKFVLRMEKRREERRNHWENMRERKKKLEEERRNSLREKEKQIKALEESSKRKKLQELRERKKVEEEKKKEEKIKIKLAEFHYERTLLRNYGLRPWLYLINFRKLQQIRCLNFFGKRVLRRTFTNWKIFVRNQVEEKQIKIRNIYNNILQKTCLKVWIKIREERIKQYQAAIDLYDLKITEKTFTQWLKFTQEEQLDYFNKIEIADLHYTKKLKVTFLKKWKNYPEIQRFETAKEERKRIWRQKVKQILPDYRPVKVSDKF